MNLDKMNKTEMVEAAKGRGLDVSASMSKGDLRRELEGALAKERAKREEGEAKAKALEPTEQGQPLTAEQRKKLHAAADDEILAVLADPALSAMWRGEFQAELDGRTARGVEAKRLASMQSPIERFKITKGGPFVVNGRITQVRTGGVVTATTHSLDELRRQRIEFEPLRGTLGVGVGALGVPTTTIVEDPPEDAPESPA